MHEMQDERNVVAAEGASLPAMSSVLFWILPTCQNKLEQPVSLKSCQEGLGQH